MTHNPFAKLSTEGLPLAPEPVPGTNTSRESVPARHASSESVAGKPKKNRGRVDIVRQTAGRGGKTVTVVKNFVGIGLPEKEKLA